MGYTLPFSLFLLGILVSSSLPAAKARTCPRDWPGALGNCYAYFDEKQTWAEAEKECQSYGPGIHLASILSHAERVLVAKHISTHQQEVSNVWIGLRTVGQSRRFKWTDESLINFKSWYINQPDNGGGTECCVELLHSTGFQRWNDNQCAVRKAYICKKRLI